MDNESQNKENKEKTEEAKKASKLFDNPWKTASVASIVLCVILIAIIVAGFTPSSNATGMVTSDVAAQKALNFIENNLVSETTDVSIKEVAEEEGLYKLIVEVKSGTIVQEVDAYISKDGRLFFPQVIDMDEFEESMSGQEEETTEVPKTDKPEVHAFVMSYCPYGLQFMKAYVPVMELLGDKADLEINFVSYAMHGKKELDENLRMYCIQKEQGDKLTEYLRCFLESDDYEACIQSTGIDSAKLDSCIQSADDEFKVTELYNDKSTWSGGMYPMFPVEDDLNEEYAVRGSPTFVVNGNVVSVARSSEAVKDAICSAFNTPPAECEQELNSEAEQSGIGAIGSGTGTASDGSCG